MLNVQCRYLDRGVDKGCHELRDLKRELCSTGFKVRETELFTGRAQNFGDVFGTMRDTVAAWSWPLRRRPRPGESRAPPESRTLS